MKNILGYIKVTDKDATRIHRSLVNLEHQKTLCIKTFVSSKKTAKKVLCKYVKVFKIHHLLLNKMINKYFDLEDDFFFLMDFNYNIENELIIYFKRRTTSYENFR